MPVAYAVENHDMNRTRATIIIGGAILLTSIVLIFNFGTLFGVVIALTTRYSQPLLGLLMCVFAGWIWHRNTVIALAVLVIGFMMSAYVVPEEDQVVIIRTGEPVGTVNTPGGETDAGLYFRVPFIDSVNRIEKRLLDLEMTDEEVLSADQQRLLVNAYARFRITDPVRMVERAGSTDGVRNALEPILNSVLRQELGRRTFQNMRTAERGTALANVRANLDRQAAEFLLSIALCSQNLVVGKMRLLAFGNLVAHRAIAHQGASS